MLISSYYVCIYSITVSKQTVLLVISAAPRVLNYCIYWKSDLNTNVPILGVTGYLFCFILTVKTKML